MLTRLVVAAFLASSPAALAAPAKGCAGVFTRDSQGYLPSEGGAEPTADRRKKGATGVFTGYDVMDGTRYYMLAGGDLHEARAVKLAAGCRPTKIRQY